MTTPASESLSREVAGFGERELIERIRTRVPPPPPSLMIGIGDDAAVAAVDRGALQVLTTDAVVEGVHFDWRFSTPADVGYKALAVNVSDVAAMGATPRFALLSLILPSNIAVTRVDALLDGLLECAGKTGVALAGGNIARSPGPLIVDVTVAGSVRPRRVLTRAGGHAGDELYVSGTLGGGAAGLGWLRRYGASGTELPDDPSIAGCVARHRRPEPRTRVGALLGRTRTASACIDLSDGLADGVRQIAEASGTGAIVDSSLLPVDPGASRWFTSCEQDPLDACLAGGDDYELLFALPRRSRSRLRLVQQQGRGVPLTRIGELTAERTLLVRSGEVTRPLPSGFSHF